MDLCLSLYEQCLILFQMKVSSGCGGREEKSVGLTADEAER